MAYKIYKLQHEDGHFYIGSTYLSLSERLQKHRGHSKEHPDQKVYAYINNSWDKVEIVLLETFECNTRPEQLEKENEYIRKELDNPLCLNYARPVRSETERIEYQKQHYEENREHFTNYKRSWYERNRDRILKKLRDNYKPASS